MRYAGRAELVPTKFRNRLGAGLSMGAGEGQRASQPRSGGPNNVLSVPLCRAQGQMPPWAQGPVYLHRVVCGAAARASEPQVLLAAGSAIQRWPAAGEVTTRSGECPSDRPPGLPEVSSRHCRLGQGTWPCHHLGHIPLTRPQAGCPNPPFAGVTSPAPGREACQAGPQWGDSD